jgi:hypothetical protein
MVYQFKAAASKRPDVKFALTPEPRNINQYCNLAKYAMQLVALLDEERQPCGPRLPRTHLKSGYDKAPSAVFGFRSPGHQRHRER